MQYACADLWNKLDHRGCIEVHRGTAMPFLVLLCKFKRLQVPGNSSKDHLTGLAGDVVVEHIVAKSSAAAMSFLCCCLGHSMASSARCRI